MDNTPETKTSRLITLTDELWDIVDQIKKRNYKVSITEALRHAIVFTNSKENPAYIAIAKEKKSQTPQDKAELQLNVIEAREKKKKDKEANELALRIERGHEICTTLRGKEVKDRSGTGLMCEYRTYGWLNPKNAWVDKKTTVYLEDLTPEMADMQYYHDSVSPAVPMPADQVIATLVELGVTDNKGNPL